jgi:flagellar biosynthesis/type III secretory pathway M-ring protein FliF/YscJ
MEFDFVRIHAIFKEKRMWRTKVVVWIFRILIAVFVLFILIVTLAVICLPLCSGRSRDWEADNKAQMEAMKKIQERNETRK